MDFMNEDEDVLYSSVQRSRPGRKVLSYIYDFRMPRYAAVMVDVINFIWNNGTDGRRGNTLMGVTILKMKHLVRRWFMGRSSEELRQIHLHIDDPTCTMNQKQNEQERRDHVRDMNMETKQRADEELKRSGFPLPLETPWGNLMRSSSCRDSIASLHLFCGAVAGTELAREFERDVDILIHGGCFSFSPECISKEATELTCELATKYERFPIPRDGEVVLRAKARNGFEMQNKVVSSDDSERDFISVPRERSMVFGKRSGLRLSEVCVTHGESETWFVATFKHFVIPLLVDDEHGNEATHIKKASCLIVSMDTDVTVILTLAHFMRDRNVIHLLRDCVIDIDALCRRMMGYGLSTKMLACTYVLAGRD
ncbi:hypothetical protein BWQ96_08048 [Gracilariopsis chorda]|uniref:Uncharacterized protein n=1 Tax=Gracilariopsis chorda TaxID=448386 RepID=A0A2V3IM72_9FLOR|nr:hypothetical protein BWQ96_08048 [Gracilariopsis chorda]|eukprot:PXF42220.1 hypothetical protein BWQ96_08048 [Gracilariopsis chorda]